MRDRSTCPDVANSRRRTAVMGSCNVVSGSAGQSRISSSECRYARASESRVPGATRMMKHCPENTIYCSFIICFNVENLEDKLAAFFRLKQVEHSLLSQSTDSILKNVRQGTLQTLSVAMPPKELQTIIQQFNAAIALIFGRLSLNQQENQHLAQPRDWLLPLLMNGQVKVAWMLVAVFCRLGCLPARCFFAARAPLPQDSAPARLHSYKVQFLQSSVLTRPGSTKFSFRQLAVV